MAWKTLGGVAPKMLADSRTQLHWAAQIAASFGLTFADPKPDWSHTSLQWNGKRSMLVGAAVGKTGVRAAIRPASLEIVLMNRAKLESFALIDRTLDEGYAWLQEKTSAVAPRNSAMALIRPGHEMPPHPVSDGARFDAPEQERIELSYWYANANIVLADAAKSQTNASPVRCWPHHFDIATLITIDPDLDAEQARSIGVGMSPGDDGTSEPYFYVTPWPYPSPDGLPELPVGRWNTDGWVGAKVTGTELLVDDDSRSQLRSATMFVETAVAASRRLLEHA